MGSSDSSRFFEDMAKFATGAAGAFSGLKRHLEDEVRACATRFAREMDFVPRDEFEIVEAMAKKARSENEDIKKRLEKLEEKFGIKKNKDIKPPRHQDTKKKVPVRRKAKK